MCTRGAPLDKHEGLEEGRVERGHVGDRVGAPEQPGDEKGGERQVYQDALVEHFGEDRSEELEHGEGVGDAQRCGRIRVEGAIGRGKEEAERGVEARLEHVDEEFLGDALADASLLQVILPEEADAQRRAQLKAGALEGRVGIAEQLVAADGDHMWRHAHQQRRQPVLAVGAEPAA